MNALRFSATCVIVATLLILSGILVSPTLELLAGYHDTGLGPGVLPAISLGGTVILSVYVFFSELGIYRRSRAAPEDPGLAVEEFGLPLRGFLSHSVIVLVLLWGYVALWQGTSFIPATVVFTVGMGISTLPATERKQKNIIKTAVILTAASVSIWAIFVHLLGVPLR